MQDTINKIIKGEASPEERNDFYSKLEQDPTGNEDFKKTFYLFSLNGILFNKIPDSIKGSMFNRFWGEATKKKLRFVNLIISGQAAAILFLVIYMAFSLYSNNNNSESYTLVSEKGSVSHVTLDDGTTFWLNTSSLAKVTENGKKEIIVSLSGEAYFEVEHNPDRVFIVEVGDYRIKDIGTSFNIKAYPDKSKITVSMFDGLAVFENSNKEPIRSLHAGEEIQVDLLSGKMTLTKSDYQADIDWKEGKFVFEEVTFLEIIKEFEEWYDVEFMIKNEELKNLVFTGILKRKSSIENLVHILKLSSEFEYTIELRNDGSSFVIIY